MRREALLTAAVACAVLCGACRGSSGEPAPATPLEAVREIHRNEDSGIAEPAAWIIRTQAGWDSLWARTTAAGRWSGPQPRVEWDREMLVAVAGGTGSPESPLVTIRGYTREGDTLRVFVDRELAGEGCTLSDLLARPLVVAALPRYDGPASVVQRSRSLPC